MLTTEAIRAIQIGLRAVKYCIRCRAWLPIQRFYLPSGAPYSHCSQCHREAQARYARRSRAA